MLTSLEQTLNSTCMLGLTYFDLEGTVVKQSLLGGRVISIDKEKGITLQLLGEKDSTKLPEFIIPTDLACWFNAPKGDFHTSQDSIKISNPDYLVTWDIHQTQEDASDGEQQWWEWIPRTSQPKINV